MSRQEKIFDDEALQRFCQRVEEMKAMGHRTWFIADQLGVPKTTINERLRKYRQRKISG